MPELLLSLYFSYKNALLAKAKGFNTVGWVLLTLLGFLLGELIAMFMVIGLFYRGPIDQKAMLTYLFDHPIHIVFIYFTAVGGCLLVRYILERMKGNIPPPAQRTEEDNDA